MKVYGSWSFNKPKIVSQGAKLRGEYLFDHYHVHWGNPEIGGSEQRYLTFSKILRISKTMRI